MDKHIHSVGVLFLAFGAQGVFMSLVALAFTFGGAQFADEAANNIITGIGLVITVPMLLIEGLKVIAGIGLLKRKPWARILVLVLAFPSLIFFPIGTGYGIYAMWVLLRSNVGRFFEKHDTTASTAT